MYSDLLDDLEELDFISKFIITKNDISKERKSLKKLIKNLKEEGYDKVMRNDDENDI